MIWIAAKWNHSGSGLTKRCSEPGESVAVAIGAPRGRRRWARVVRCVRAATNSRAVSDQVLLPAWLLANL